MLPCLKMGVFLRIFVSFVSSGLSDRFMALISHCSQQSSPMTKEQKRQSLAVAKKIICENRKEAAEYIADSAMTATGVEFGGCIIEKNRKHIWFGYAN